MCRSRGAGLGVEIDPDKLARYRTDLISTKRTRRTHDHLRAPAEQATAAASGASATQRFHTDKSPFAAVKDIPAERVDLLAREILETPSTPRSAATR